MSTEPAELTLPPLPPRTPSSTFIRHKKRSYKHTTSSPCTSSDPALFSSDDHLFSGAENYTGESRRKKRVFLGAWWDRSGGSGGERGIRGKRKLRRVVDSGVWMGSEGTEGGEDEDEDEEGVVVDGGEKDGRNDIVGGRNTNDEGVLVDSTGKPWVAPVEIPDGPLAEAEKIVQRCVEEGNEHVNLSDLLLPHLPATILHPLALLTKNPPTPPTTYHPLTPNLHLFLSHNALRVLPPPLLTLTNLSVLSLRNNKLTTLPDAISRLQNLVELNVAGNRLRWLPWGVVRLVREGKLEVLRVWPNPFLERAGHVGFSRRGVAREGGGADDEGVSRRLHDYRASSRRPWQPTPLASTPPSYLLPTLTPHASSPPPPSLTPPTVTHLSTRTAPNQPPPPPGVTTGPPPLMSLALLTLLRAYGADPSFPTLPSLLPSDSIPQRLMRETVKAGDEGGRQCTVCRREYVIPRTEWIEWWNCVPDGLGMGVPVLRRGCRWSCVV
ncbi:hypothetical protein FGG08_002594 [Glutinoglossum americanum]|uniref:Uncharacterized protein n=1 Tax=Glutinoglossum americanum TaxID=1670608 RepID=A0A9P8ICM8_9PEZI|nr:hypothetical protein FGG08_002594 [Glutinoglossum americanum]